MPRTRLPGASVLLVPLALLVSLAVWWVAPAWPGTATYLAWPYSTVWAGDGAGSEPGDAPIVPATPAAIEAAAASAGQETPPATPAAVPSDAEPAVSDGAAPGQGSSAAPDEALGSPVLPPVPDPRESDPSKGERAAVVAVAAWLAAESLKLAVPREKRKARHVRGAAAVGGAVAAVAYPLLPPGVREVVLVVTSIVGLIAGRGMLRGRKVATQ